MSQILAVLSPDPLASRSVVGFQAHIKTSDSCPRSTVALDDGISMEVSTSIVSGGGGGGATAAKERIRQYHFLQCLHF